MKLSALVLYGKQKRPKLFTVVNKSMSGKRRHYRGTKPFGWPPIVIVNQYGLEKGLCQDSAGRQVGKGVVPPNKGNNKGNNDGFK